MGTCDGLVARSGPDVTQIVRNCGENAENQGGTEDAYGGRGGGRPAEVEMKLVGEVVRAGGGALPSIRVWWDAEWEEFRVTFPGNPKASHHTGSFEDAKGTALHEAGDGAMWLGRKFRCPEGHE